MEQEKVFCICKPGKGWIKFMIVISIIYFVVLIWNCLRGKQVSSEDEMVIFLIIICFFQMILEYKNKRFIFMDHSLIYIDSLKKKKQFQYNQIRKVIIYNNYSYREVAIVVEGQRERIKVTNDYEHYEIIEQFFRVNMPDKIKEIIPLLP